MDANNFEGLRIAIDLKKDVNPEIILNADNIWTALGIGIVSGLSSTGTNQLIKQTFIKNEGNENV